MNDNAQMLPSNPKGTSPGSAGVQFDIYGSSPRLNVALTKHKHEC